MIVQTNKPKGKKALMGKILRHWINSVILDSQTGIRFNGWGDEKMRSREIDREKGNGKVFSQC